MTLVRFSGTHKLMVKMISFTMSFCFSFLHTMGHLEGTELKKKEKKRKIIPLHCPSVSVSFDCMKRQA